jgi:hypothetical protein
MNIAAWPVEYGGLLYISFLFSILRIHLGQVIASDPVSRVAGAFKQFCSLPVELVGPLKQYCGLCLIFCYASAIGICHAKVVATECDAGIAPTAKEFSRPPLVSGRLLFLRIRPSDVEATASYNLVQSIQIIVIASTLEEFRGPPLILRNPGGW